MLDRKIQKDLGLGPANSTEGSCKRCDVAHTPSERVDVQRPSGERTLKGPERLRQAAGLLSCPSEGVAATSSQPCAFGAEQGDRVTTSLLAA